MSAFGQTKRSLLDSCVRFAQPNFVLRGNDGVLAGNKNHAFTLAELLIALAILGVIATFTIPKILDSGSSSQKNAIAKETIAAVSGAYQNLKLDGNLSASTTKGSITPYLNYVSQFSTGSIDHGPTGGTYDCTLGTRTCLRLHNGAVLAFTQAAFFGGTLSTHALSYLIDPDGQLTNDQDSLLFAQYYNGRVMLQADILPNTSESTGNLPTYPTPSWFSWGN